MSRRGWKRTKKPAAPRIVPGVAVGPAPKFARHVYEPPKFLDLLDIVAGGNGTGHRRGRGIDPISGRMVDIMVRPSEANPPRKGDGQYHRVPEIPFIDGVFTPSGEAVQTDSAGHLFYGFRDTTNLTPQHIWAGGEMRGQVYPTKVGGVDYASPGHGLLFMHSNVAITFDLEAVRRANPGTRLLRFRATAGNVGAVTGIQCFADVWVLVDAKRRYQRRLINNDQDVASVLVPIGDKDRFLTLAVTDANDGISMDWIILGDPRLELRPAQPAPAAQEQHIVGRK